MGCDLIRRATVAQMLVICLWLQHISASLSVPSAFTTSINSSEGGDHQTMRLRIRRADGDRHKRKYSDYSDDVVSRDGQ